METSTNFCLFMPLFDKLGNTLNNRSWELHKETSSGELFYHGYQHLGVTHPSKQTIDGFKYTLSWNLLQHNKNGLAFSTFWYNKRILNFVNVFLFYSPYLGYWNPLYIREIVSFCFSIFHKENAFHKHTLKEHLRMVSFLLSRCFCLLIAMSFWPCAP